jgi:methylaspartate ammonia-lyase
MGSLIEELQRRGAAAHQKADELCDEINAVERAAGAGRGEVVPAGDYAGDGCRDPQ